MGDDRMKKFDDVVIHSVDYEPIVGGRMADWIVQLMKNQNEIIDFIHAYKVKHPMPNV